MNKKLLTISIVSLVLLFFFSLFIRIFNLENKNLFLSRECYRVITKKIRGNSMAPLLNNGETVKFLFGYYDCHPFERNDLVVISFKTQPFNYYVKRLVGLPNDKVEVKNNILYINNQLLRNSCGELCRVEGKSINLLLKPLANNKIPQGYFLVLSEEAGSNAFDSRFFGYIEKNHIKGKVIK